jgi:hypothetical protein
VASVLHQRFAMQDLARADLSNVVGGGIAALRNGIAVIKSVDNVDPRALGGAAYDLSHTRGGRAAMQDTRAWLGGSSINHRIDVLMSRFGMMSR